MSHKKTWSIKTRNAGLSNYVKCTWHDSCLSLNWTFRKQDLEWFFENKYFLHTNSNWSFSYLTMKKPRNGYESLRTWVYITGLLHEWSVSQLSINLSIFNIIQWEDWSTEWSSANQTVNKEFFYFFQVLRKCNNHDLKSFFKQEIL